MSKASEEMLTRAAGVVGLATSLSRLVGFVRNVIIMPRFGASMAADACFAAFALAPLWRWVVGEGARSARFWSRHFMP